MQYFGFDRPSFAFKTYGFGDNFDPLTLFTDGKQGVWYDPSDKSTLFQDVAGTVPVTKDGDPVALMRDKSGNGNHAVQTVSTARPVYKTDGILHWLKPDGVDDVLYTENFNLGEYDGVSSWIGIREEREGNNTELLSFSEAAFSTDYSYSLRKTPDAYKALLRGSSVETYPSPPSGNAVAGSNAVVSLTVSTLQGSYSIARNNDPKIKAFIAVGTLAPLGNHPLYIAGRPAGFNTKSRIYGIVIAGEKDEVTETKVLQYLSKKSGVTL